MRNHGSSFHLNSMSYDELASDVIETLKHLKIEQAYVLGHSMGGKIAMKIAAKSPDLVQKLIIADIAPVEYPPHHNRIIEGLKAINISPLKSRKDADQQLSQYVEEASVRQFLLRNLQVKGSEIGFKCNVEFISNNYDDIVKGLDSNDSYSGDTLFIKGGNSDYITIEHQKVINKHFPNASAKIIQGAGHWLHAEKTVAFNKIVNDFLAK